MFKNKLLEITKPIIKKRFVPYLITFLGIVLSISFFIIEYNNQISDLNQNFEFNIKRAIVTFERKIELNTSLLNLLALIFNQSDYVKNNLYKPILYDVLKKSGFYDLTFLIFLNEQQSNFRFRFKKIIFKSHLSKDIFEETSEINEQSILEMNKIFNEINQYINKNINNVSNYNFISFLSYEQLMSFKTPILYSVIPIYEDETRQRIVGYVVFLNSVDNIIERSFLNFLNFKLNLLIKDTSTNQLILSKKSFVDNNFYNLILNYDIDVLGFKWNFNFGTQYRFLNEINFIFILFISILGIILSCLIGFIIRVLQTFTIKVEKEILDRTHELKIANEKLTLKIEERNKFANELEISNQNINNILESISDGFLAIDKNMCFSYVNYAAEKILNLNRSEIIGKKINEVFSKDWCSKLCSIFEKTINEKTKVIFTEYYDQLEKWIQAHIYPYCDGISIYLQDVTEAKENEKKLYEAIKMAEKANKAKSEFLAVMSHEIRTPINAIIGFTEILMETNLTDEQLEYAKNIKTGGEVLSTLIGDILDFSKIESGKLEIISSEFNLYEILKDVISMLKIKAMEKNLNLNLQFDEKIKFNIISDPLRLKQIIINLVGNAIKFTESGEVILNVMLINELPNEALIKFEVSDTGIGIPEDKLELIFKPFVQADGSITRKFGGTGLGLAISNKLVELLGGNKILVKSKLNEGSTFYFEILFKKGSALNKTLEPSQTLLNENINRLNDNVSLLLVEDNNLNIKLMTSFAKKYGYNIDVCENGQLAIEKLKAKKYDLILMDVQMPVLDGIETTKIIRQNGDKTPIVAMTAAASKSDEENCMNAGMNYYISKPINFKKLNEIILNCIKQTNKYDSVNNIIQVNKLKIFDLEQLKNNMDNDWFLMSEIVKSFIEAFNEYISEIDLAIKNNDPIMLKKSAHKLKGSALNASAIEIADILLQLEKYGEEGIIDENVNQLFLSLNEKLNAYQLEVKKYNLSL